MRFPTHGRVVDACTILDCETWHVPNIGLHGQQGANLDAMRPPRYAACQCVHSPTRETDRTIAIPMNVHPQALADFRSQVTKLLHERDREWELSRRLVESTRIHVTLKRLIEEAHRVDLPDSIRAAITVALKNGEVNRLQELPGPRLKELTGLPPTKAIRALCVWFDLVGPAATQWPAQTLSSTEAESFVRAHTNPFDLLLESTAPSVLDVGAGDLSFADELASHYGARLRERGRSLILHCLDRLRPDSQLGGPLHPERQRLDSLRARPDLMFRFHPDQDMFALDRLDQTGALASHYTIAACWAPATPTFAYEPTRLSADVIEQDLQRTKGAFRQTTLSGEPALEVQHGDRTLLFPPWKFEIRGPLALLDLLSRRGCLCVLGAVDRQVFWELLAQLLDDARYRPKDQLFTSDNLPEIFDTIYTQLMQLQMGETVNLSRCATLRMQIPRVLPHEAQTAFYRFRAVQVRRGAVFPGMPASSTARRFQDMAEETPPWLLTLVPE